MLTRSHQHIRKRIFLFVAALGRCHCYRDQTSRKFFLTFLGGAPPAVPACCVLDRRAQRRRAGAGSAPGGASTGALLPRQDGDAVRARGRSPRRRGPRRRPSRRRPGTRSRPVRPPAPASSRPGRRSPLFQSHRLLEDRPPSSRRRSKSRERSLRRGASPPRACVSRERSAICSPISSRPARVTL